MNSTREIMEFQEELVILRNAINDSAEHTKGEINSIDTNLYAGAILSSLIAFGLTYYFQLVTYWIPAGFSLLIIWTTISLLNIRKPNQQVVQNQVASIEKIDNKFLVYFLEYVFKLVLPFARATSVIFGISFVFILISTPVWFKITNIWSYFPILALIIWMPGPLIIEKFIQLIKSKSSPFEIISDKSPQYQKLWKSHALSFAIFTFFVVLGIIMLLVPLIALWTVIPENIFFTYTISFINIPFIPDLIGNWEKFVHLILVLVFQVVVLIFAASYFSALAVKKELVNTLTQYASLNQMVHFHFVKDEVTLEDVKAIKSLLLSTKRYDLLIDDSFQFVNFYLLKLNPIYLRTLIEMKSKSGRIDEGKK